MGENHCFVEKSLVLGSCAAPDGELCLRVPADVHGLPEHARPAQCGRHLLARRAAGTRPPLRAAHEHHDLRSAKLSNTPAHKLQSTFVLLTSEHILSCALML